MISRLTKPALVLSLAALVLFLNACDLGAPPAPTGPVSNPTDIPAPAGSGSPAATHSSDASQLVRLGFVFDTTGENRAIGQSQRRAAEMAWKEIDAAGGIDGHQIAAVFEDGGGNPDQAAKKFQKLTNTDVVLAIMGPTFGTEAGTTDPAAQRAGIPVLAVSDNASSVTGAGNFVFADAPDASAVLSATVKQAKAKLGISKAAILYNPNDAFSKSEYDTFKSALQGSGVTITGEQTFASTDKDFKTQLAAIKSQNPDAIVVAAPAEAAQAILEQARKDAGISSKVPIIGGSGFAPSAVIQGAGAAAEGLVVGSAWNPSSTDETSQKFATNYKKLYGSDPDQFAAQSYAGLYILADAIKRANPTDLTPKSLAANRQKVRTELAATKDLPTVLGPFSFTGQRGAGLSPVVLTVKNGKLQELK